MNIPCPNPHGPADEATLIQFENRIAIRLPDDYRSYLLSHNGGIPDPCHYEVSPRWGWSDFETLAHVAAESDDGYSLDWYMGYRPYIPDDLIAVGDDGCGDLICLGIKGRNRGKVFFRNNSRASEVDDIASCELMDKLADSFSEFMGALTSNPDDE